MPRPVAAVLRAPPWRGEAGGPGAGAWGGSAAALGPLYPARRLPVVGGRLRGGVCGPAAKRMAGTALPRGAVGSSPGPPFGPGSTPRGGSGRLPGPTRPRWPGGPGWVHAPALIRKDAPRMSAAATPGNPHFTAYRHPVLPLSPPRFAPYPGGVSAPPIRGDFDQFSRFLGGLGAIYNFLDGLDSLSKNGYNLGYVDASRLHWHIPPWGGSIGHPGRNASTDGMSFFVVLGRHQGAPGIALPASSFPPRAPPPGPGGHPVQLQSAGTAGTARSPRGPRSGQPMQRVGPGHGCP